MGIVEEYRRMLKMAEAEETLDLLFYRPIAYFFVRLVHRTPITPNQMTFLSLAAGLVSAYYYSLGTLSAIVIAGIWYTAANVLDCGDGMLARLQGSGTPLGRLVDGVVDWITSVAIFVGLGVGLTSLSGNANIWYLIVAAGISSAMHAMVFDMRQQEFISTVRGEDDFLNREEEKIRAEYNGLKAAGAKPLRRIFLSIYLSYMNAQSLGRSKEKISIPRTLYRDANLVIMRRWTWLGPTTNRTILIVTSLFGQPEFFLYIVLVPGNLYLIAMLFWQRSIRQKLRADIGISSNHMK